MPCSATVGTFLVIFLSYCTPSQSVLNMCRNDTETGEVVHLYRVIRDGDPTNTDCHCKIRPSHGDQVGIVINTTYINGCQYSLTISHNNSKGYLNCDSNLLILYYNIPIDDEITLGILEYKPAVTDGFNYAMKINATDSNVTVICNTAEHFPVITSYTTSTTPLSVTGSVYTSQSRLTYTSTSSSRNMLSTRTYRSTSRKGNTQEPILQPSTSLSGSTESTKSQPSTTRLGNIISSTFQGTTLQPRTIIPSVQPRTIIPSVQPRTIIPSVPQTVNLKPSVGTTDSRPTQPTLYSSTKDPYRHQPRTKDSAENENLVIGVGVGCLVGGIVIGVLLVLGFQCIRKKKDPDYEVPNIPIDDHTYQNFRGHVELSQRSQESPVYDVAV